MNKTCSVKNCENTEILARGYCQKHYLRWWKHGDPLRNNRKKHGLCYTPEYMTWARMKTRCYNKKTKDYKNYGGRGIIVCDKWKDSFLAFYADMGIKPTNKHTLERVNNDKGYYPENVIWALSHINYQNKRNTKLDIEKVKDIRKLYAREIYTQTELAIKFGISIRAIGYVIHHITWNNVA